MNDINPDVCLALLREYLSGYRGYPQTEAGEKRFATAIQENVLGISHARAVLVLFDEQFPTVRQIHETAWSIRPQFEKKRSEDEELRAKYGEPRVFDKYPADQLAMHWQAIRDSLYYTEGPGRYEIPDSSIKERGEESFWSRAMKYNTKRHDDGICHADAVADVREQVLKHGWNALMEMTSSPSPFRYSDGRKSSAVMLNLTSPPITQEDFDKLKSPKPSEQPEGWDDPNR